MIDYQPLYRPVAIQDRLREPWGWMMIPYAVPIVAAIGWMLYQLAGPYRSMLESYIPILVLGFVGITVFLGQYNRTGKTARLRQFADANGMQYSSDVPYDQREGMIFGIGDSRVFFDLLKSDTHNFAEICNYRYVTGSGRSRRRHYNGFVRIALDRRLPHMVLDARANNFLGRISNLSVGFSKDQRLGLEGDFDNYFSLYAPPQYKTDALYIFTPDVMASMIDKAHAYDVEIIDNNLYLYSSDAFDLTDEKQLQELFIIAEKLRQRVNKQARNYEDERTGLMGADVINEAGARMKTGISPGGIVAIVIMALYIILMLWPK